jgi:hypothetical protein
MQLIFAIAKSTPRQVSTKYGQKTVIDATDNNGEAITIWRGGDDKSPALKSITNGSRITVGLDSKGKYSLIEAPADRVVQAAKPISPEPAEVSRPMGFAVDLPFEAEQRLWAQLATAVAPPLTERASLRKLINAWCRSNNIEHEEAWRILYAELLLRDGFSVNARIKNSKVTSKLELVAEHGKLGILYAIATEIFKV